MDVKDIIKLEPNQAIKYLKKRKTKAPDTTINLADWDVEKHEIITDKVKYPNRETLVEEARDIYDDVSGKTVHIEAKYEDEPANRISIPLEQDIVNIHTAFTVGTEPKLNCEPANDEEKSLLQAINSVLAKNKIKYQNKKIVRSWLSEQEVAEYWYTVDDDSFWVKFWTKVKTTFGGESKPTRKLKSVIWSPFRGDKLYPLFNDKNDMIAFSREYEREDLDGKKIQCFQTITNEAVYQWELVNGWQLIPEKSFKHRFKKLPVLYAYLPKPYCHKIKTIRVRIEKLLSSYADCIDYHFFPILKLFGDVEGITGKKKDKMVKLTGEGADAQYLVWQQAPTTVELELDTMFNNAYSMTGTPRISFENLKGTGNALSGNAFEYVFLSTHLQVENHAEDIGNFLQRRINFLASAMGSINPYEFGKAAETIDIDTEIVPFKLEDIADKVSTAVNAVKGGVWSRRQGVMFAGLTDQVDEVLKEIEEDSKMSEEGGKSAASSVS